MECGLKPGPAGKGLLCVCVFLMLLTEMFPIPQGTASPGSASQLCPSKTKRACPHWPNAFPSILFFATKGKDLSNSQRSEESQCGRPSKRH